MKSNHSIIRKRLVNVAASRSERRDAGPPARPSVYSRHLQNHRVFIVVTKAGDEGCAVGVPAGNAARLPKLDDISEPVLDEAERSEKMVQTLRPGGTLFDRSSLLPPRRRLTSSL